MTAWDDYKKHVRDTNPEAAAIVDEAAGFARVAGAITVKRHEMGLSVEELAERCGVSASTIQRIESCSVTPNVGTVIRILKALGCRLTVEPWGE